MIYASKQDIERLYGLEYLADLLPSDLEDEVDIDAAINDALESASSEVDAYLSVRYTLPLPAAPKALRRPTIDVAAYVLANRQSRLSETIETRYDQTINFLERLSVGKAGLGADEPKVESGSGTSQSGSEFSANKRKFKRGGW